jgi:phosphomannomutase
MYEDENDLWVNSKITEIFSIQPILKNKRLKKLNIDYPVIQDPNEWIDVVDWEEFVKNEAQNPNGRFTVGTPRSSDGSLLFLQHMISKMKDGNYDLGIVVDPDVDRLCFISEDGTPFGEEYTLVAIADYILSLGKGNTVSNLSSTRALRDVTEKHGGTYFAAAVGEVNVVNQMKAQKAVIGGEGNGGVIFPESHYGRDALVGIGLFLTYLAQKGIKTSELRASFPSYVISKNKIELSADLNVDLILSTVAEKYKDQQVNTIDGVKIDFPDRWIHLRKSNTEPIIRIYAEAPNEEEANALAQQIIQVIEEIAVK